jgi:hypothetical protein
MLLAVCPELKKSFLMTLVSKGDNFFCGVHTWDYNFMESWARAYDR